MKLEKHFVKALFWNDNSWVDKKSTKLCFYKNNLTEGKIFHTQKNIKPYIRQHSVDYEGKKWLKTFRKPEKNFKWPYINWKINEN